MTYTYVNGRVGVKDKIRKSTLAFKRRRANAHRQNCAQTAKKEAQEGKTYESGIGLNLDLNTTVTADLKRVFSRYGKEGVIAILSKPPSSLLSASPHVTTTTKLLATMLKYFDENMQH
ncbi:hypothetical protein OS493_012490 [Desmophyllum pertusum]|uniref:Uncharacterized protein n=1 Tax=Desmophyllum pertusum TaxID=174260 RepID=A0A9X0D603_9CNID|nr:hypothetical protein OS493_012490 [Desmophyllum pertusum]